MIGKIWFNPSVEDKCFLFLLILDDLDYLDKSGYPDITPEREELVLSDKTHAGDELDIAANLYQTNRNRYPSLIA